MNVAKGENGASNELRRVNPTKGDDPWGLLPDELALTIFSFLPYHDFWAVSLVCKLWNRVSMDDKLWKNVVKKLTQAQSGNSLFAVDGHYRETAEKLLKVLGGGMRLKLVIVGDGAVGKSTLLIRYTENRLPVEYIPTIHGDIPDGTSVELTERITLSLVDTAGGSEYSRLSTLTYPGSDVFLLAFSMSNPYSLDNIEERWFLEVQHYEPEVPIVMVGLKCDDFPGGCFDPTLTHGTGTIEQAETIAKRINAAALVFCSAMEGTNVDEVFEIAVSVVLSKYMITNNHNKKQKPEKVAKQKPEKVASSCLLQ